MFWLISVVMLVIACINHNDTLMLTSGLFAIAGSLDLLRPSKETKKEQ